MKILVCMHWSATNISFNLCLAKKYRGLLYISLPVLCQGMHVVFQSSLTVTHTG